MFVGTTPPEVRSIVSNILKSYKGPDIFIGCSGNYTIDCLCSTLGYKVHSNDVSLYSRLIADILLGKEPIPVEVINDELKQVFDQWPDHPYKQFIEVLFTIKVSQFNQRKNDYQKEMWEAYMVSALEYFEGTLAKFYRNKVFEFAIEDFFYGDFVEHILEKCGNGVGILFPPTYAMGYEKMFSFIDASFKYPKPNYRIFDPDAADPLFEEFLTEDENIIYTDVEWPNIEDYLKGKVSYGGRKHDIYIYSSVKEPKEYYVVPRQKLDVKPKELVSPDFEFTEDTKIEVIRVSPNEVNYYKSFFMALKVDYSTGGDLGVMFLADGKVFGFAVFSERLSDDDYCFLHSDFVVDSNQKQLSKLVLFLLRSKDIQHLLIDRFKYFFDGLKTTVYTDKPVSMKYRGVFKLERRDKGKLIYKGDFNNLTIKENYKTWLSRISKKKKSQESSKK